MGLFKSIKKGLKKIVKGVGKVAGKVFEGVKSFAKSNIGKLVIAAAAVYFTAGAAAYLGVGATAGTGVAGTAAAFSPTAVGATLGITGTSSLTASTIGTGSGAAAGAGSTAATIAAAPAALPTSGFLAATQAAAPTVGGAITGTGAAASGGGLLASAKAAGSAALKFAGKNPVLALGAVQAVGSGIEAAATPSAGQIERQRLSAAQKANSLGTLYVGNTNVSTPQPGAPTSGAPAAGTAASIQDRFARVSPQPQPQGQLGNSAVDPAQFMTDPGASGLLSQAQLQRQADQQRGLSPFIQPMGA